MKPSLGLFELLVRKDLRFESKDLRAFLPRVRGQSGLEARLHQKQAAVPVPFERHLWEQQTSAIASLHDQPVTANVYHARVGDLFDGSQHRDFETNQIQIVCGKRREPWILGGRRDRTTSHDVDELLIGVGIPDATAQLPFDTQRDERAAATVKSSGCGQRWERLPRQVRSDCLAREAQERPAFGWVQQHRERIIPASGFWLPASD